MIADLKPYPKYKDSGLPWLELLPSHWDAQRSKYLFREVDQRSVTGDETRLSMSQRHGLIPSSKIEERRLISVSNVGGKLCETGDLVLNRLKAHLGVLALAPTKGLVSPDYTVLRPIGAANHRYFCAIYRSPYCGQELRQRAKGIVEGFWRLYTDDFYDIRVPVPPSDEQALIVRFLDWANDRLERTIRAKRKVIALLNEQKQAMIHRAVTRGLGPNVPLKDSGISWLGNIPQHWDFCRLKQCVAAIQQGWSPQCDAQPAELGEWGVLKVGCVNKDRFASEQNKKLPASLLPDRALEIQHGDILVSRANTRELLGLAAFAENPPPMRILCDKLFRFRAKPECFNPKFLVLALRAKPSRAQIESSTNGASSSMQNIGQGVLKNLWLSMPSVAEQDGIVEYLKTATQPIIAAISRLEIEIELLREYRTRLVADVVTGKLDVRALAATLPDAPAQGDDNDTGFDDDTLDDALDDAPDTDDMDAAA